LQELCAAEKWWSEMAACAAKKTTAIAGPAHKLSIRNHFRPFKPFLTRLPTFGILTTFTERNRFGLSRTILTN
jgi:hypothetical protein